MTYASERNPKRTGRGHTRVVTAADLPPSDIHRWVTRLKAIVVTAVDSGIISLEEACNRYNLSVEEFMSWQRLVRKHGTPGLRTTRTQLYRN